MTLRAFLIILLLASIAASQTVTVTSTPRQTMRGWDVVAQSGQEWKPSTSTYEYPSTAFANYDDNLFAKMLELGINRITVEVYMDDETTDAYTSDSHRTAVNDDGSPSTTDLNGFGFERLDHQMESIVVPYKAALLAATGESLWVTLRIVDFRSAGFQAEDTPAEYAEFVYVMVDYTSDTYGIVFNSIDAMNEPDQGQNAGEWTATKLTNNIVAADARLDANGYSSVQWTAPSYGAGSLMKAYWDSMQAVDASITSIVKELSYHNYGSLLDTTGRNAIRTEAEANGQYPTMTECSVAAACSGDGGHLLLYDELIAVRVSSWLQFANAFPAAAAGADTDDGGKYFLVNTSSWAVTLSNRAKYLKHYFKYVRANAVMYDVTNSGGTCVGTAFRNSNGKYVVVLKATASVTCTVSALPPGTYGRIRTQGNGTSAPSSEDTDLTNATVSTTEDVTFAFTAAGVGTIYDVNYLSPVSGGGVGIKLKGVKLKGGRL